MKKVLFVATVDEHIRHFHLPYLAWFAQKGYEVHVAANGYETFQNCSRKFNVCYQRTPFSLANFRANHELRKIVTDNKYELVHFHTPVASVFGRWVTRKTRKFGSKILYTAHGFHFYKGAPIINWLFFYPMERLMARFTDYLITINEEDFARAEKFVLQDRGSVWKVPGIGVNIAKFHPAAQFDKCRVRQVMGIPEDAFVVLAVGELIARKNHQVLLRAISLVDKPNTYCVIAGRGSEEQSLRRLASRLQIADKVRFLGYCKELVDVYHSADIFAFPSLQEGLPVALMEAMASGLPCIASEIRGNIDLIKHEISGLLFTSGCHEELARDIVRLREDTAFARQLGAEAAVYVRQFDMAHAMAGMNAIYEKAIGKIS